MIDSSAFVSDVVLSRNLALLTGLRPFLVSLFKSKKLSLKVLKEGEHGVE